jgi:RNA polymerase sigma-70 factor (ECF subfamily)
MLHSGMGQERSGEPASIPGASFAAEVESFRTVVAAVIASILRQPVRHADVEDCTHETFERAYRGRDRLRAGEPLRPWLLGIARHVALDAVRARQRRGRLIVSDRTDDGEALVDRVPDSAPSAQETMERAQRSQLLRDAMARLPADLSRALVLFHVEGLAYRDIAERMNVPIGTVCTWISRGRRAVASALEEQGVLQ